MTDYRVGIGHDVVYASCVVLSPQPMGDPVAPVTRNYGVSGKHQDQGKFLKLHWDHIDSPTTYLSLLTVLGLSSVDYANVSVYARSELFVLTMYNGIIHRPEPTQDMKWNNFFIRDLDIYITDLEVQ